MTDLIRPILKGLESAHGLLGLQLSDLKNEDAVRQARGDTGCSISWIVGHLLSFRCSALTACGADHPNPYQEKFSFRTPASDGSDYPQIGELHRAWDEVHGKLIRALSELTEEQLRAGTDIFGPQVDQSLLEALDFFPGHEAYHLGAVGLLRVQWGYRPTQELAMEAKGIY